MMRDQTHISHSPYLTVQIDVGFLQDVKNCSQTVLIWHSSVLSQLCVFQSAPAHVSSAWTLYTSLQWLCRVIVQATGSPTIKLKIEAGRDEGVA